MNRSDDAIVWEQRPPLFRHGGDPPDMADPDWMRELSAFRGRVFYCNGGRPRFRTPDGQFVDYDVLDRRAHHILARQDGELVGCLRMLPLSEFVEGLTESIVGRNQFRQVLTDLGACPGDVMEPGRLVVDPECRLITLGLLLVAGGFALARELGFRFLLASIGTKYGQDRMMLRFGEYVPGIEPLFCGEFADTVRVMYGWTAVPKRDSSVLIQSMSSALAIDTLSHKT